MPPVLWGRSLAGKKGFRYTVWDFRGSGKASFWCTIPQVAFPQPILHVVPAGGMAPQLLQRADLQGTGPLTMGLPHKTKTEAGVKPSLGKG